MFPVGDCVIIHFSSADEELNGGIFDTASDKGQPLIVVLTRQYPGYLSADAAVEVMCRVSGQLIRSNVSAGQRVRKGDVLWLIDPTPYRDAVRQAEATHADACTRKLIMVQLARRNLQMNGLRGCRTFSVVKKFSS